MDMKDLSQGIRKRWSAIRCWLYRTVFQRNGPVTRIALVMFGALAGSLVGLLGTSNCALPASLLVPLVLFIVVLLFLGLDVHYWMLRRWYLITRCGLLLSRHPLTLCSRALIGSWATAFLLRSRIVKHDSRWFLEPPRIGIMTDLGWDQDNPSKVATYTSIGPQQWQKAIRQSLEQCGLDIAVELVSVQSELGFHKYLLILNPYGGVYPEHDLEQHSTFSAILEYTRAGGIFANVGDVPFFWAYSPSERRPKRCVGSAQLFTLLDGRHLQRMHTPLLDRLQVPMYAVEERPWDLEFADEYEIKLDAPLRVEVNRMMQVGLETGTGGGLIARTVVKARTDIATLEGIQMSPFCRVDYGCGEFIVATPSLFDLNDGNICRLHNAIADVVVSAVAERLPASNEVL